MVGVAQNLLNSMMFGAAAKARGRLLARLECVTLGVKAAIIADDKLLLVKHSYVDGWSFPGGSVQAHEHPDRAMIRELSEEIGLIVDHSAIRMSGSVFSTREHRSDDVLFSL